MLSTIVMNVLLVTQHDSRYFEDIIGQLGGNTSLATCSIEAKLHLHTNRTDLILAPLNNNVDEVMELLLWTRENASIEKIPFILVYPSGLFNISNETLNRARNLAASDFLFEQGSSKREITGRLSRYFEAH